MFGILCLTQYIVDDKLYRDDMFVLVSNDPDIWSWESFLRAECVVKIAIFLPFELVECMLNNKNNRLDFSTILEKGGCPPHVCILQ